MSQILIVSKTRMGKNGACIGGITIPDLRSVRLMNEDGSYHNADTKFEVGQLWDIDFINASKIIPPHIENVLMRSKKLISKNNDIKNLIDSRKLNSIVFKGSPSKLFNGLLRWTRNSHGFISENGGIPDYSTGFWITDQDLIYDKPYYNYPINLQGIQINRGFKYVGFADPIPVIPAGTKLRVSLAKWWHPEEIDMEDRCYLQLSGWYL